MGSTVDWVKRLLRSTREQLLSLNSTEMLDDLWMIVIGYVCEDPRVADIIALAGCIIRTRSGNLQLRFISNHGRDPALALWCNGNTFGKHGEVYSIILDDSMVYASYPCAAISELPGIVEMRELLYKKLKDELSVMKIPD